MRGIAAPHIADDGSFLSFSGREYRLAELGMHIKSIRLDITHISVYDLIFLSACHFAHRGQ